MKLRVDEPQISELTVKCTSFPALFLQKSKLIISDSILHELRNCGLDLIYISGLVHVGAYHRKLIPEDIRNSPQDKALSHIIKHRKRAKTYFLKYSVRKSAKAQFVDVHYCMRRVHSDYILLCLHCKLIRNYDQKVFIFFRKASVNDLLINCGALTCTRCPKTKP